MQILNWLSWFQLVETQQISKVGQERTEVNFQQVALMTFLVARRG